MFLALVKAGMKSTFQESLVSLSAKVGWRRGNAGSLIPTSERLTVPAYDDNTTCEGSNSQPKKFSDYVLAQTP